MLVKIAFKTYNQMKHFHDEVAETLLIPLYMRAKESRRGEDAILRDPVAQQVVDGIDYDWKKFDGAKLSEVGSVVRCWYLDNVVREFVAKNVHAVVVNVGCGLDPRCQRTLPADSTVPFYSLDLKEVIEARRKFIPEAGNETYLTGSLLETDWMEMLRRKHPAAKFLFIFEGVLMYFEGEQVKQVFGNLATRFQGGSEVWLDVCGPFTVKHSDHHDAVKKVSARFHWGLEDGHEVEQWDKRLHLIRQTSQGLFFRSRYPFPMNILSFFPKIIYKFCSIVGYSIG